MDYEELLTYFDVESRRGDTAKCLCPCHADRPGHPSLMISRVGDKILVKCQAECKTSDILAAKGLKMSDLFIKDNADYKPKQAAWMRYIEARENKRIVAVYHYEYISDCSYCFSKIRMQDKQMIFGRLDGDRFTYGLGHKGRKGCKALYSTNGLKDVLEGIKDGQPVFIPEGEKDVDTLTQRGYIAVTSGSADDWQSSYSDFFRGANVYILADNDAAGIGAAEKVRSDVSQVARSVKVIIPTPNLEKGDITDYFESGKTNEDFENLLKNDSSYDVSQIVKELERLDVINHYPLTDIGSARLFSDVFKKECRYSSTVGDWMKYDGKRWTRDTEGMFARGRCKLLADGYSRYVSSVNVTEDKQRSDLFKYASTLMSYNTRNKIINDSKDVSFFQYEELDSDDYILNCLNGTLDLHGDEVIFRKHDPDDLLSKVANVEYDSSATCPLWVKSLDEIFEGDTDKIEYLQRVLGLCLSGDTSQEELYFLYGATSRNGKSTITETVLNILDDYGQMISPETLAIKTNKDSRTASPDIAKLAGARLVIASEPPKRMLFDSSLVKTLTGRDRITARFLHENEFSFTPKFKLILNTNYLPSINDNTIFMSGRIKVIEFNKHFSEEEQDKSLKEKLRTESSGILNWMISGYFKYKRYGLKPPQTVTDSTNRYADDSDKLGMFISECLTKSPGNSLKAGEVYQRYATWTDENGFGTESKSSFFADLKTRGMFKASGTINGMNFKNVITGYRFADESEDFSEVDEDFLPFEN